MNPLRTFSITEQVAAHLRAELHRGRWRECMPGRDHLAAELGASPRTVQGALALLQKEGLLQEQGAGRQRRITMAGAPRANSLRVQILLYEPESRSKEYLVELRHQLDESGHETGFSAKSLQELGMDPERVARFVNQTPADAWVVVSASLDVLNWFAHQPVPTFALFGRNTEVPMAGTGPRKSPVVREAVRRLATLGHRRIVLMSREERRKPHPGLVEKVFLEELQAHGIVTGPYNLPNWGNTMEDFHAGLDTLFRITPPTAILCPTSALFIAAERHLARLGIVAPRDISMICLDPEPVFAWCQPAISHIRWSSDAVVRRVVRWVGNVARGREDRRIVPVPATFIEGGTIGPAPARR